MSVAATLADTPDDSRTAATHAIMDWCGVAVAGAAEPLAAMLVATFGGSGSAALIGHAKTASAHDAAMINGAIGHALDYDDVHPVIGHPSAAIAPALFALADERRTTGADFLLAYIAGYEAAGRVGAAVMPTHYEKGFHSTGTVGSIGAAVAAARLLGLDVDATARAIALAATQAAGLKAMFGTMAKPLHAGKAAANGIIAAKLAAAGFTAAPDALEADQGFLAVLAPRANREASQHVSVRPEFGSYVRGNLYKYHASCYLTHSALSALAGLRRDHGLEAPDIASVQIIVPKSHFSVCNIAEPRSGLESKFSLRHVGALALSGAETGDTATFSDEAALSPLTARLRELVEVQGAEHPGSWAEVLVKTVDGRNLDRRADVGVPSQRLDEERTALKAKFDALLRPRLGGLRKGAERLGDMILAIEMLDDAAVLPQLMRAA